LIPFEKRGCVMKNAFLVTLAMAIVRGGDFSASARQVALTSGDLLAGAAKEDMGPPEEVFAPGVAFFDRANRDFIGVHDPLFVRSIVLDNGLTKAAFVSLDIAKIPGEQAFLDAVAVETGIEPEHLFVSATHDHNTVEIKGDPYATSQPELIAYYELIRNATIKSLKDAESRLQPASIGYAAGRAYVNTNRDEKIGDAYHMGYNPDGPSDKTVAVVSLTSLSGEPIAILYNYAVHGVVMYRAKTRDGHPEVTGDLPGATSRYVEAHFDNAVAMFTSGAAGDQNPLFMANYNQDAPDVHDLGAPGYALLDVQSRRLGEEVVRLTRSMENTSSTVRIWGKKTSLTLPGRKRKEPGSTEMIDGDPQTLHLNLFMINDIAFAGVCGEVFTEIGMHLKERSPFDHTMMVTLMPPNTVGYVATDAAYLLPSEKAITNSLKPGYAEPAMIGAFLDMMKEYAAQ
jgi:hypothetical protein